MNFLTPAEQRVQVATEKSLRRAYRSDSELAMRDAMEVWCRGRWPAARLVHELVMDRGTVRADLAAIDTAHIAAFEIKSEHDNTLRLLHQVGMFRLAVPELWMVTTKRHSEDAALIRYLMPSVGLLRIDGVSRYGMTSSDQMAVVIEHEPTAFAPIPKATLQLCWAAELWVEAIRAKVMVGKGSRPPAHAALVKAMEQLDRDQQMAAVCRQLRARQALWRADPPIKAD